LLVRLVGCLSVFCTGACGYRFGTGSELPGGVTNVAVALFENRSGENRLPQMLSSHLTYELTRRRMGMAPPDEADAVIRGVIRSIRTETVSWEISVSRERKLTVVVDARLERRNGDVIWAATNISAGQTFAVSQAKPATERNRREALDSLSRRLAENVYEALMDRF
jgi:outer membrane lipopolysaccharide assembly protein LptE/RlpB